VPDSNTLAIQLRQHAIDFADVESSTYEALRDAPGIVRTTEPRNDFNAYAMNEARPLLAQRAVRRAIVQAIDRAALVQTVTHGVGTVAYGDLPLFMYGGRPPAGWAAADPAGAASSLERAGWKLGPDGVRQKDGTPLRLQLVTDGGSASSATIAVEVQAMLRRVGIAVDVKAFATALYYTPAGPVLQRNFDLALVGFSAGNDTSNDYLYRCANRGPGAYNFSSYCSAEMERLLDAADREYDTARRNALVARIEALAVDDAAYAFLYHTPYRFASTAALRRPPASLANAWYGIAGWSFAPP
jgi:peptide/nickel transport system substrate-binding protein